ncbi:hypothetical protein BDR22DRAFT_251718 [Usnea florida]
MRLTAWSWCPGRTIAWFLGVLAKCKIISLAVGYPAITRDKQGSSSKGYHSLESAALSASFIPVVMLPLHRSAARDTRACVLTAYLLRDWYDSPQLLGTFFVWRTVSRLVFRA